jgi:hypothetical protein
MSSRTVIILLTCSTLGLGGACAPGYAPADSSDDATLNEDGGADTGDLGGMDAENLGDTSLGDVVSSDADIAADTDDDGAASDDDTGPSTCAPNHDGTIERSEVTVRPGLHATFRVAEDVTVDTHGTEQGDGSRMWDLSRSLPGDESVLIELQSLDGKWFKPEYPAANYTSKLAASEDELGVFSTGPEGLYLNGVVSSDEGTYATELHYDPPASVLEFPIEQGSTWSSTSSVTGRFKGNPWTSVDEEYQAQVDASGTLKTPFGTFDVLRVRTDLTRTVGFSTTTQITYSFVSECFGTVATIRSKDDEDDAEFTQAATVRRLTQ